MKKMMIGVVAVVGLMCAGSYSFADEMGKMSNEMKGEMKAATDAMKAKPDLMKGEMKGEMKAKTESMKASKDTMKDEMKATKDSKKDEMKGATGY